MSRMEYQVKVAYDGDDLVVSHDWQNGQIVAPYDSEEWTASDAAKDLISNLHDVEVEIDVSADIPGGKLYVIVEATPSE